ncbi:hypothetical protein HS088_TW09G00669 [Tripterygium wilfordii]|uniref:Uncharacterized protein n=1 Tax=Tripterygium wilfordii TaxID=458696 RepID=A0A7J7D8K3_TRIWF|nr:hypothetical protein HS088_TW09G00669 [Tripterygium wilfordii]
MRKYEKLHKAIIDHDERQNCHAGKRWRAIVEEEGVHQARKVANLVEAMQKVLIMCRKKQQQQQHTQDMSAATASALNKQIDGKEKPSS